MREKRLRVTTSCAICAAVALVLFQGLAYAATHKVQAGDTLWSLARKHHTTPKAIAKANGIGANAVLALGKSLTIPGKPTAARTAPSRNWTRAAQSRKSANTQVHTKCAGANLRAGASTSSRRVCTLPKGITMKYLARQGNWAKVALSNGVCGYVYRPLLGHGVGSGTSVGAPSSQASSPSSTGADPGLIRTALSCRGIRYSRGGTSRGGFDCSGFTRYVFAKYGVSLPHSSAAQARLGAPVSRGDLKAGDLVFFQTYRRGISHVGIYVGNNSFVHAATYGRGVRVDSLSSGYYASRYRGARRVK